jgi:hypothetical protein
MTSAKMRIFATSILFMVLGQVGAQGISFNKPINDPLTLQEYTSKREIDPQSLQEIHGVVSEAETKNPIQDATVILVVDTTYYGVVTDAAGRFIFHYVPIGRHQLIFKHVSFKVSYINPVVTAARSQFIEVVMELFVKELEDVEVIDQFSFSYDVVIDPVELSHHAGRPEAIRKLPTGPGTAENDDSRNDLVVRGNSPQSNNWRIEGVNIPNPNHFNIPGTTGGPVSFISDKVLTVSNFYSGPFGAEFGNSTSAAYDLHLRSGDTTNYYSSVQFGLYGGEITAEGPLSKKSKSSALVHLRRSVLDVLDALQLDIGTNSIPKYTDGFFKLNFPLRKASNFWLFGIAASSRIDIKIDTAKEQNNIYGEKDRDQLLRCFTNVLGIGFEKPINKRGHFHTALAFSSERTSSNHYLVYFPEDIKVLMEQTGDGDTHVFHYDFRNNKLAGFTSVALRVNKKNLFKAGASYDVSFYDYVDEIRNVTVPIEDTDAYGKWRRRLDGDETAVLLQPFFDYTWREEDWEITGGIHGQYYSPTKSTSVEPRLAVYYYFPKFSRLKFAYGHHSATQQPYAYFYGPTNDENGNPILENKNLDFTRSIHTSLGYELKTDKLWTVRLEAYYQRLYNVPVERDKPSSYSLLNAGADFARLYAPPLVNEGAGKNYGVELTVDRSFNKGYLLLLTGTLFNSTYRGSDYVWRSTDFNSRYILNLLATKEWTFGDSHMFSIGMKFTTKGGRWYGPIDTLSTGYMREVVYDSATRNSKQFAPYRRFDIRVVYRRSGNRVNHEFSLDLINAFNFQNVLKNSYFPHSKGVKYTIEKEYQLGILPFFYYRMDILFKRKQKTQAG